MAKKYTTIESLLNRLVDNYTTSTYFDLFELVTDDDFEEFEERLEAIMGIYGELFDDTHEDGTSTEEYLEIFGVER